MWKVIAIVMSFNAEGYTTTDIEPDYKTFDSYNECMADIGLIPIYPELDRAVWLDCVSQDA